MGAFGDFSPFCERAPLPACRYFPNFLDVQCPLVGVGIPGHKAGDLGTVIIDIIAVLFSIWAIIQANSRSAAVGRREFQLVLGVYMLLSFCDIFTTGKVLPELADDYYDGYSVEYASSAKALLVFTSLQIGLLAAFFWMLMCFGFVGFQLLDDGTVGSIGATLGSGLLIFGGTFYIALDTGFGWSEVFMDAKIENKSIALYVLYLGVPLICSSVYLISQLWLVMRVIRDAAPLVYLLPAALFFAGGQVIEFVASTHICYGTGYRIDGAFFQTLMSLLAMVFLFIFWVSTTEDTWPSTGSIRRRTSTPSFEEKGVSNYSGTSHRRQQPLYRSIEIEKPAGLTVEQGVRELNRYKADFLSRVESEVLNLIKYSRKRDVTAILAGGREYHCIPSYDSGYLDRFKTMMRHKDQVAGPNSSLPVYNGEELDSWLTPKIMERVGELYLEFFNEHSDVQGKVMLQKLRNNPTAYKRVGQQFAESLRAGGEPLTEEMCQGLVHLISEQLSNHSMDHLGTQLGHALMHVGGASVITSFATTLVHTIGHKVASLAVKMAGKISLKTAMKAGGKMIAKMVVTGFLSTCATAAAAKGMGTVAAIFAHAALPVILAAVIAYESSRFTKNLADEIAPEVRKVMAGEFENKNRSMLEMIGRDSLEDFATQLGKALALENELVEGAKETAKEMVKANLQELRSSSWA